MRDVAEWVGRVIAGGRYEVRASLTDGNMGYAFRAYDRSLETDVVIKMPVNLGATDEGREYLQRFEKEIRALVRLSHPHIVKIIDVGQDEGHPYVVMQYLEGGSLKRRAEWGPGRESRPLPARSLRSWLEPVAKALDFIHLQQHIHRDVKPANIFFDAHNHAFLGDFGLIKGLTADSFGANASALTGQGFLAGTPNFVAPEVVRGKEYDGRADQYSLAMTVHEILVGRNVMEGPTASATMVNQTTIVPPAPHQLVPGLSHELSEPILRALSKDPGARFESCQAFAVEVLGRISAVPAIAHGADDRCPCPACGSVLPLRDEMIGRRVRCRRCGHVHRVGRVSEDEFTLSRISGPNDAAASVDSIPTMADREPVRNKTQFLPRPKVPERMPARRSTDSGVPAHQPEPADVVPIPVKRRKSGKKQAQEDSAGIDRRLALGAVATAVLGVVAWLLTGMPGLRGPGGGSTAKSGAKSGPAGTIAMKKEARRDEDSIFLESNPTVVLNIAYGTEKQKWLEEAVAAFRQVPGADRIEIKLFGMGSIEGAQAVLNGPDPVPIHVWSPASSVYRDVLEREWGIRHGGKVILEEENLALTPMVMVMWRDRYERFVRHFEKGLNFTSLLGAMTEPGGWSAIGGEPDWGLFKFSHTNPEQSNSGLLLLVMMAYEFNGKDRGLTPGDVAGMDFQGRFRQFLNGVVRPGGVLTNSTGTLMKDMTLRGPSQYDSVLVYENVAIESLKDAESRWGPLTVVYPTPTMWNENPYYILDVPWSSEAQRSAARAFLKFLMSEEVQAKALAYGFRPGNPKVGVNFPESPFLQNERYGIRLEIPRIAEPPKAEVVDTLISSFRRAN